MNKKYLLYLTVFLGIVYYGLEHMNEKVADIRVVDVSADETTAQQVNVQQFYPVLAQNLSDKDISQGDDVENAFFITPPEEELTDDFSDPVVPEIPLELNPDVLLVDIPPLPPEPPEPEPIDPINFLADYIQLFNVQATMPEQKVAIINGWAYNQGERLPITIPVSYTDRYGEQQRERLDVTVKNVSRNSITLSSESERGWPQSLEISI